MHTPDNLLSKGLSLSACLIVRNESYCLARCLDSLVGVVDEIILVDTGSTDQTLEIARRYTDKIYHHDWQDDFATARNQSLMHASGDWILIIDADEALPAKTARLIPDYLTRPEFQHQPLVLNWHLRRPHRPGTFKRGLFPNHQGIRFAGRVHEIPVRAGEPLPSYHCHELVVLHADSQDPAKQRYYQQLMRQSLAEERRAFLTQHIQKHLGASHLALAEWQSAWGLLLACRQGLSSSGIQPGDEFYRDVLRGLIQAGQQLRHPQTQAFVRELQQLTHAKRPSLFSKPHSSWKKVLLAGSMSLLVACQSSAPSLTSPGPKAKNLRPITTSAPNAFQVDLRKLQQRYGPWVKVGTDYPEFQNYLVSVGKTPSRGLEPGLFRILAESGNDTSHCYGPLPGYFQEDGITPFIYHGVGDLRDRNMLCEEPTYEDFAGVNSCYNSGGIPIWQANHICELAQGCYQAKIRAVLHLCEQSGYEVPAEFSLSAVPAVLNRRDELESNDDVSVNITQISGNGTSWTLTIDGPSGRVQTDTGSGNGLVYFSGVSNDNNAEDPFLPEGPYQITLEYEQTSGKNVQVTAHIHIGNAPEPTPTPIPETDDCEDVPLLLPEDIAPLMQDIQQIQPALQDAKALIKDFHQSSQRVQKSQDQVNEFLQQPSSPKQQKQLNNQQAKLSEATATMNQSGSQLQSSMTQLDQQRDATRQQLQPWVDPLSELDLDGANLEEFKEATALAEEYFKVQLSHGNTFDLAAALQAITEEMDILSQLTRAIVEQNLTLTQEPDEEELDSEEVLAQIQTPQRLVRYLSNRISKQSEKISEANLKIQGKLSSDLDGIEGRLAEIERLWTAWQSTYDELSSQMDGFTTLSSTPKQEFKILDLLDPGDDRLKGGFSSMNENLAAQARAGMSLSASSIKSIEAQLAQLKPRLNQLEKLKNQGRINPAETHELNGLLAQKQQLQATKQHMLEAERAAKQIHNQTIKESRAIDKARNVCTKSCPNPTSDLGRLIINRGTRIGGGRYPETSNPNQILYKLDTKGNFYSYQTYDSHGLPVKRVDLQGKSHNKIDPPHVQEYIKQTVNGEVIVNKVRMVRPAESYEIP